MNLIGKEDLDSFPERNPAGNKGDFGKCLIAGGSIGMCGAPYFAGKSAYRTGAGIVRIYTCIENLTAVQVLLPEAVLSVYEKQPDIERLEEDIKWADAAVSGPGLGCGENSRIIVDNMLSLCEEYGKALILDADALNVISADPGLKNKLKKSAGIRQIITPHPGEMSRLTGKDISYIKENSVETAIEFARDYGVICVLKDAVTVITDGDEVYISAAGNDGMATAGSGDVLAGILLGTITAYKHSEYNNLTKIAAIGTYIHGLAGDEAAKSAGRRSMMATDIIAGIGAVMP